jgi:hypothetical protein
MPFFSLARHGLRGRFVLVLLLPLWFSADRGMSAGIANGMAREQQMLADAADGRLDEVTLADATWLANAVYDGRQREQLQVRLDQLTTQLRADVDSAVPSRHRVVAVYDWMHARVLTGQYQADCTQLARTLQEGHYNCVSATVLFHVLCRAVDLHPVAVATPTHVYSRVYVGREKIDVQTTCPQWFRLTDEQQRRHLPPGATAEGQEQPRELGDIELLAKVYYNRGVRWLEAQRFEEAETAFRCSLRLDPQDRTAHENLLAALNNWALDCCDQGEFARAAELLRRGWQIDAQYSAFRANDLHIHQRWAQNLCQRGDYRGALDLLEQGRQRQPDAPLFRDGPVAVYRMWVAALAERGEVHNGLQILAEAQRRYPQAPELAADRLRLFPAGRSSTTQIADDAGRLPADAASE